MNTRDQFGNYLLLKKLSDDAYGETFRAGRIGNGTLERIVQLRVYNGQGFDGERIARALQARSALGQALKSANIAQAVDVGQVRGVPYVAYDYAAGRSLAQLLEQAARRSTPMPLDHALLVAERMALALAVAHEIRFGEERVQHGFVTPQMVQVSNEGELKLLGFEAAAGLRESANHPLVKQSVGRYLSPETLAGQPATRADDVYSVGAILFEMLTGQSVPMLPAAGLGTVLDQAVVPAEGTHLPAELAALLKRTLCPRDQRVADVVSWHKTLVQLMSDSGQAATTFNLAFFLHSLFRDEIDREAGELEAERAQAAALVAAAAPARAAEPATRPATAATAAAAGAPSPVRSSGPIRDESAVLRDEYGLPQKKKGGNQKVVLAAAAGGLVVLAVVGYLIFGGSKTSELVAAPPASAPAQVASAATATPAPAPTGMTPEQIQALIAQALEVQKKQIDAGQKSSDEQIKALQRQLEDSQRVRSPTAPQNVPSTPLAATPASLEPQAVESEPTPVQATPAASAPAPAPVQEKPAPSQEKPAPVAATPLTPAPKPTAAGPAGAPRVGDLVTPGPGVTMPRVLRQPPLNYPPVAKRLKKEATVQVRVLVDEDGRVSDVQTTGAKAGFGMDEAAIAYARNCQFEPATKAGVRVKIWYDLRVAFKL